MKVLVVGGGPGGLYAALLLKKLDAAHEITVLERNPAGATYGWGVVFSNTTLTAFREADYKTYKDITDQFVIWDPIDVRYRGQVIRCGGHTFAGMSRRALLSILTQRCLELGVNVKFETELSDFNSFANYDVVIAADGINSTIRKAYADTFKPRLIIGKARYIWFGTHRVFDSFTFIIRENEHGLFQVHSYPFDGNTSTFIVECGEATWNNARLDPLNEAASIAYCENLFADVLQGHRLMSNRSTWVNFVEVKNKTWRHENIVLLGDSAHTAHFSIGSGTRLAMEDSIALANAFELHGNNVKAAINAFERERKPRVEIIQAAAEESQAYFENLSRYKHLEPEQFAFQLLTRSGRLSYDHLRIRDPYFVDRVDRWFNQHSADNSGKPQSVVATPPAYVPLKLGGLELNNRVALAVPPDYSAQDGLPTADYAERIAIYSQKGAALLLTEPVAVSAEGRITSGCMGLYSEKHRDQWAGIVAKIHEHSQAKIALQLSHSGCRGSTRPRQFGLDKPLREGGWSLLAPSAMAYSPNSHIPKAMDRSDMERVCTEFVNAAKLARAAGFDALMLNFAHGYLLSSYLSPLTNLREDEYGGSLENRLRFPLEIFRAVRSTWGNDKPLMVVINASDWSAGGFEIEEATEAARLLKTNRCDMLYPLAGQVVPDDKPIYGPNFLSKYSDSIRNDVGIATLTGGGITLPNQINSILAAGGADLCVMEVN